MPKQLVTALGLVVALGVIALGVFLVALPLYFQAVAVDGQTATVANTNSLYQTQVDRLTEQQENLDEIDANVTALRSQIPSVAQLDDVFEVVARAADASGVTITAVTAGEQAPFVERTSADPDSEPAAAPSPESEGTGSEGTGDATGSSTSATEAASGSDTTATDSAAASGRQQVDFAISATAGDMGQATAFLDALRAGPRLLSNINVTTNQSGEGTVDIQISALTYVDEEG